MKLQSIRRVSGSIVLTLLAANCICTAATGFVSLEKDAVGVWWFKSPEGKQFLSIGANHVEPVYWQSPSNSAFVLETYGPTLFAADGALNDGSPAADKWAQHVATNFNDWGFNTFGFHNPLSKSLHAAGQAYYVVELDLHVPWGWNMSRATLMQAFKRRPFDVFGDAFVATVKSNAVELVKPRAADPQVLGYAYTDGPPWTVDDEVESPAYAALTAAQKTVHPWVLALMSLPAEAKGKQAWLALMKERYASAEAAGAVYGKKVSSWDELASTTAWKTVGDAAKATADSQAFLLQIMRQWYEVRKAAIREHDPNHLILGDKLNANRDSRHPAQLIESLKVMDGFVDVINIQYYSPFEKQRDTLALLYRESHKPILNGDTAINPLWKDADPDEANPYSQLGQTYASDVSNLFSLPYFIGWHHCGYIRGLRPPFRAALMRGDQKALDDFVKKKTVYREGFITQFEKPVDDVIKPLSRAVLNCEKLHRASGATN
ncbi:MAG: hypothetical protein NTZ16_05500 [Verrucomicrobia bacterium]|nr:hypothetical protein [Verrucomicrobiota bacterium]